MKRAILFLALGVPTSLAAQSATTTVVSSYVAADAGVAGGPLMVGLNVTRERGWTGVRVGAAVDAGSTFGSSGAGRLGVFSSDVDAMVNLGGLVKDGSFAPYLLAGVGGRVLSGAHTGAAATWGYGVGARAPLGAVLNLEGEIRYREPVGKLDVDAGQNAGMEFRFGGSVRMGRAAPRTRIPAAVPFPRSIPASLSNASSTAGTATAAARRRVAERALDTADDYLGVRYTWGGNDPQEGFDCSGFVRFVFARQGIVLPRVSRDQAQMGMALPLDIAVLEPGDLIAFAPEPGSPIDHIAIYAGEGRIIHSSSSGYGVRFDDLYSERGRWYREHMVAARRVIDAGVFFSAE
jgi:cell wall-associated NlpC family hydrolase